MVQLGPRATCANAPLSEVIANLVRSAARVIVHLLRLMRQARYPKAQRVIRP